MLGLGELILWCISVLLMFILGQNGGNISDFGWMPWRYWFTYLYYTYQHGFGFWHSVEFAISHEIIANQINDLMMYLFGWDITMSIQPLWTENAMLQPFCPHCFNTLRPRQNGRHFADDILKCIFLNENVWIPIEISLKFVPKGPIDNIPALV